MNNILKKYSSIVLLMGVILIWQLIVVVFNVSDYLIPSPSQIIVRFFQNIQVIAIHSSVTIFEAVLGLFLSIAIGVGIAILFDTHKHIKKLLMPYISTLQMIPAIVIAPLFALWFGFGLFPKILLIVIFCSFPIIVSLVNSFEHTDPETLLYLKTLKMSKVDMYKTIYIPYSLPALFSSVRIATTYALINAIFAEYMGAKRGLGVYLSRAASSFSTVDIFTIIVVIIVVTMILLKLVDIAERRVVKWN